MIHDEHELTDWLLNRLFGETPDELAELAADNCARFDLELALVLDLIGVLENVA